MEAANVPLRSVEHGGPIKQLVLKTRCDMDGGIVPLRSVEHGGPIKQLVLKTRCDMDGGIVPLRSVEHGGPIKQLVLKTRCDMDGGIVPLRSVEHGGPIKQLVLKTRCDMDGGIVPLLQIEHAGPINIGFKNSLGGLQKMTEEDAFFALQHECGVCPDNSYARGWRGLIFKGFHVSIDKLPLLKQYNKLLGILGRFTQHKMNMDESIQVSCIIDKLPLLWKDFKHTLKHLKEELTLIGLGSHLRIEKSPRAQDSDKPKGNNVAGHLVVNMVKHNNSSRYNDNKGKRKHHDTKVDPNKKPKVTCWKCEKHGHLKRDCKASNVGNKANGSMDDDVMHKMELKWQLCELMVKRHGM
ncbi:zinc finger, CCHC-type containing protein [Tanacetum coccineum]